MAPSPEQKWAEQEMARNLCAWGVDPYVSKQHDKFQKLVVAIVGACFGLHSKGSNRSGSTSGGCADTESKKLSKDITSAVETVLKAGTDGQCRILTSSDNISGSSHPPYAVTLDKYNPTKFYTKVKWEYSNLTKLELDPFERFAPARCVLADILFRKWIVERDDECIRGHVFEAIVASHAIHNEPCHHCHSRNSLRWHGGPQAPWTDMVCIFCDSAFEIKSKKNLEKIENALHWQLSGGSFVEYHNLHKQPRKEGWKHYAVLVSRMHSYSKSLPQKGPGMHKCWVVKIAEIERIAPRLKPSAFVEGNEDVGKSIKSQIFTKHEEKAWFKIPYVFVDYRPLLGKILAQKFPDVITVDDNGKCTMLKDGGSTKAVQDETPDTASGNNIAALKEELHSQEISDCWDDEANESNFPFPPSK